MTKGFTLIEVLIIVVIIGILALIGITNYIQSIQRAREASIKANMHTLHITVEEFATITEGLYPGGIDTRVEQVNPSVTLERGKSIAAGRRIPPFPDSALLKPHKSFKNPVNSGQNAIDNSFTGTPSPPAGCVYYTGYKKDGSITTEGEAADYYKISAYGVKGSLALTLP